MSQLFYKTYKIKVMLLKGGKILEAENTIICVFQITILKSDGEQDLFFWKCYLFLSGKAQKI